MNIICIYKNSFITNFSIAFQHILIMYSGSVAVPLIIGRALKLNLNQMTILVAADLFTCGVAILIQNSKFNAIGIKLPIILGTAFPVVSPLIAIGIQYDFNTMIGSVIAAGIFIFLSAPFFSKITFLFPPMIVGTIIMNIGLSLAPIALMNMKGGSEIPIAKIPQNLLFGFITLLIVVFFSTYFKGFLQNISILLGILIGTIITSFFGLVNLQPVFNTQWINMVQPLAWGYPKFIFEPIITMCIVSFISQIGSMGLYTVLSEICGKTLTKNDFIRGFRAEGLASIFAAIFNSFSKTTYSQNVGLIELTKNKKTKIIIYTGLIMIGLSFLPKLTALILVVPPAVLGGTMIAMFGMVTMAGIKIIAKIDLNNTKNVLIIACAITIGVSVSAADKSSFFLLPSWTRIFTNSGIIAGTLIAIILNTICNSKIIFKQIFIFKK